MLVRIPLLLLCAAALAACTPNAAPVSTAPVPAAPVSSLACPKSVPAASRTSPWLPAAPRGLDGSARLAPLRVPARVLVCAYIGPRSAAGRTGSVLLTGDLSGVTSDLAWMPPTQAVGACAYYLRPADSDYYLIGLSYPGASEWVAAPGYHCAGSSNGVFSSSVNLSARASAWYQAQRWTATPASDDACHPSGFGRLGQHSSMVPDHPVSVSLCEVSAGGGHATRRTRTSQVGRLASTLDALRASGGRNQCRPAGRPLTEYRLLFGYVQGPPVLVSVAASCTPAINNGSLQSSDAATVLPLIQSLLGQR
jgi:hypothetical protein